MRPPCASCSRSWAEWVSEGGDARAGRAGWVRGECKGGQDGVGLVGCWGRGEQGRAEGYPLIRV